MTSTKWIVWGAGHLSMKLMTNTVLREATELYLEEFPLAVAGQPLITTFQVEARA